MAPFEFGEHLGCVLQHSLLLGLLLLLLYLAVFTRFAAAHLMLCSDPRAALPPAFHHRDVATGDTTAALSNGLPNSCCTALTCNELCSEVLAANSLDTVVRSWTLSQDGSMTNRLLL